MATQAMGLIGELRISGSPRLIYDLITPDFSQQPRRPNNPFNGERNYPTSSVIFNQRRIYVSTIDRPLTLFASAVGDYADFADALGEDNAFELELDSNSFDPINYVAASQFGLLLFSERNIWLVVNREGGGLTATRSFIKSELSSGGRRNLEPLRVLNNIVYLSDLDNTPRAFVPVNTTPNQFDTQDLSLYSSHFFDRRASELHHRLGEDEARIVGWTYAGRPDRLLWAVRGDGILLSCAYAPEHRVNAWGKHSTRGKFLDVQSVYERERDAVYVVVERGGHKYIERMAENGLARLEETTPMDAAVRTEPVRPDVTTTLFIRDYIDGEWTQPHNNVAISSDWFEGYTGLGAELAHTEGIEFSADSENDLLRTPGGTYRIEEYITTSDGFAVKIEVVEEVPETTSNYFVHGTPYRHPITTWEIVDKIHLYNCFHLQAQEIYVIEESTLQTDRMISANGELGTTGLDSRGLVVGIPFKRRFESLPFITPDIVADDKLKNLREIGLRCLRSSSMMAGVGEDLFPTFFDEMGEAETKLRDGVFKIQVGTDWEIDDSLVIESFLPFTVLGIVYSVDLGDQEARRSQVRNLQRAQI